MYTFSNLIAHLLTNKVVKGALGCALVMIILIMSLGTTHWRASVSLKDERAMEIHAARRPPSHTRGLIDFMVAQRETFVPAFLPQHLWDQAMCAGTACDAVNFLLGTEKLVDTAAWRFARENDATLNLVYDRSDDFVFVDDPMDENSHILVEKRNSPFKLSALLRPYLQGGKIDRLFMVGYHYQYTLSDDKIYADGAGRNSHLMLLVGEENGTWYGYHMFHKPDATEAPFHIDSLSDDMPNEFDLVYIWEIVGTRMPQDGVPMRFIQELSPYEWTRHLIGHRFLDQALVHIFSSDQQFPHAVVDLTRDPLDTFAKVLSTAGELPLDESPARPVRALARVTITTVGLTRTVRSQVHRTPGANLEATFACNNWDFRSEARHKVYLHQVFKVCAWQ